MASGSSFTVHIPSATTSATAAIFSLVNPPNPTSTLFPYTTLFRSIVVLGAAIDIAKVADSHTVSAGDPIGFTINISKAACREREYVSVNDTLPTDPGTSWSINGGTGEAHCSISAGVLSCSFGDMASGASFTVHITSGTTSATPASSPVDNTANVTTSNDGSDSASASIVVLGAAIDIAKVADSHTVSAGDPIGFTITVTNNGAGVAHNVNVNDTLPTDPGTSWSIDGGTGAGSCSISASVLSCSFGDMASGAVLTVHISSPTTSATPASSPVDNTANVTTSNDGSDSASASIVVLGANVGITKVADASSVNAGDQI